jgi:hypothetical protein
MKTLFDAAAYEEIVRRVASLRPDSPRLWGKMTASQMLEHTARALEVAAGKTPSRQAVLGKMIGWIFRKDFVGEKPFGKNAPTGPNFIVHDEPDFHLAREKVETLLREFHALGEKACDGRVHGFFGRMTGAEWGVTQYKHMDHHLRQFSR